jgi:hypothetical protein
LQRALRLIAAPQVYGGGVSFVIHPYLWSESSFFGLSTASAGSTIVSGLSALFSDCVFANSSARTRSGGEFTLRVSCCLVLGSVARVNTLTNSLFTVGDKISNPASGSDVRLLL